MNKFKLGDKVITKVSGFTGIVTAIEKDGWNSDYVYVVELTNFADGEVVDDRFDEDVLDPIECSS